MPAGQFHAAVLLSPTYASGRAQPGRTLVAGVVETEQSLDYRSPAIRALDFPLHDLAQSGGVVELVQGHHESAARALEGDPVRRGRCSRRRGAGAHPLDI